MLGHLIGVHFFNGIGCNEVRVLKSCTEDTTKVRTHSACVWYTGTKSRMPLNHRWSSPRTIFNDQSLQLRWHQCAPFILYINFYSLFQQLMPPHTLNKDNWLESREWTARLNATNYETLNNLHFYWMFVYNFRISIRSTSIRW